VRDTSDSEGGREAFDLWQRNGYINIMTRIFDSVTILKVYKFSIKRFKNFAFALQFSISFITETDDGKMVCRNIGV